MAHYWWCAFLFRIVLPIVMSFAAGCRPTFTSYLYMLMGLYLPFFSVPTHQTMAGSTGTYMKVLVIVCILICSCVVSFYFALFFQQGEEYDMTPCGTLEHILRTLGVVEFRNLPLHDTIVWCVPEPLMLSTSLLVYVVLKKLTSQPDDVVGDTGELEEAAMAQQLNRKKLLAMLLNSGKYLIVFTFCLAAVIRPSVIGGMYYLVFLVVLTYWACNKSLGKVYARILTCLLPIVSFHLTIIFFYQMQYFQEKESLRPETLIGRLFQLVRLTTFKDCDDPRLFKDYDQGGPTQAFPYILYIQYYLTALVSREILQAKDGLGSLIVEFFKRESVTDYESRWRMVFRKVKEQIDENKLYAIDENLLADRIKRMLEHAVHFIIRMSYLVANFVMMIWAITYVGWKTLILLMWANLIWLLPGRRRIMLAMSPFLVLYVWFLLITSYLYSLDVDIPSIFGIINLASGSHPGEEGFIHLLIISLFSIILFIPMRQFFRERDMRREQRSLAEAMGETTSEPTSEFGQSVPKTKTWKKIKDIGRKWFALCWIWVVVITMIWMDFMSTNDPFRITFVGLAIMLVMTFQIFSFNYWKKFLLVYWWIVITYAMINLFVVYMYQLQLTRNFLHNYVLSKDSFEQFGFVVVDDTRDRVFFLANPLFFQIAIVIQQHYLQQDFDKFTSPESPEEHAAAEQELQEINPLLKNIIVVVSNAKNILFVLLEIHLPKIILLVGWLLCCFDFCAMFVPFVFLLTASCILGRLFTGFTIYLMLFFVQILILARLIYMNQYTKHRSWDFVGYYKRNGRTYNVTLNTADWLGFHESFNQNRADFGQVAWCFFFVFIVTLSLVVRIRQHNYKQTRNMSTARLRVLFPEINYLNCHKNTKSMLKFFLNYGFYKLGIELTSVMAVIVVAIRMDAVAICLSLGLLTTFALNRKWTERVLMPYMILVGVWLPIQYIMSLGFWPTYWEQSRTRFWNENDLKVRIQQFLHLFNMAHPPSKKMIIYDFLLLMCFSRQWRTFRVIRKFKGQEFGAGSNKNVGDLIDSEVENPIPDFVTYSRNMLDVYKKLFFFSWFYISLLMTFLAGDLSPNLYSFGYILAAFFLMWEGTDMFLKPPRLVLFRWNLLILYNICILVFRTITQIVGCILIYELKDINCKIFSMFSIGCIDRFGMTDNIPNMNRTASCDVSLDVIGLKWDCTCFFFLIIQQRIFKSFHYFHIVNDAKAQTILASQGAIIIERERQKRKQAFDSQDEFIKNNINRKLQRYQENRKKIQGDVYLKRKQNHKHVLRSGDYYLFDDLERNLDIPLLPPKREYVDLEFDPYDPMSLEEYIGRTFESDLTAVLSERARRKRLKQASKEGNQLEDLTRAVVPIYSQPGVSTDPVTKPESEITPVTKLMNTFLFMLGLFESIIVSLTAFCNRLTRDFRFILHEIDNSRRLLKEKTNYKQGIRIGANNMWKPSQSYSNFFKSVHDQPAEGVKIHYTIYAKLLRSIWFLGLSQSEWLCYLVIILNQVIRANFISLPLPLMVFCWGSLTVPKPTKTFWVIAIAYALIMSIIKNFFTMEVADWNARTFKENQFYPPSIIGIDRYKNSLLNLSLLCALFLHRIVLQWLGLWEALTYRRATLIKDGNYSFKDGKLTPLKEDETAIRGNMHVKSLGVSMGDYFPRSVRHGASKYAEGFRLFIQQLISPSSTQIPVDVYTPMFLCDFINLLLIVFCFGFFGTSSEESSDESSDDNQMGFVQYLQNNRVPVAYICVIIGYSLMMVIDRWIYLRKNRFAKLIYHFFHVMATHIWAFVLYPMMTRRVFSETFVVQLFYVLKCVYFLFSAYQIRNGYPHLISQHFLTHGSSLYHRFGFIIYRKIPYLFEIRTLLDWTCIDTSLDVYDFFKMEEIMQCIFDQKCQQEFDARFFQAGGKRKNRTIKYLVGGFLFTILFLTIIFPFFIFSLSSSVGVKTHPAKLNLELYMGSAEPIFSSYASQKNLITLTDDEFMNLTMTFNNIRESEVRFGAFKSEDVVVVKWSSHSLSTWRISPGGLKELIEEMKSTKPFGVRVLIRYTHVGSGGNKNDRVFGQTTFIPPLPDKGRQKLLNMLEGNGAGSVVWLPLVFPKFLMITKEAKPKALPIMEEPSEEINNGTEKILLEKSVFKLQRASDDIDDDIDDDDDDDEQRNSKRLRNILLSLQKENGQIWWQMREDCDTEDDNFMYYLKDLVHNSCEHLVMYTFNEKVFSKTMGYVTGSGIFGLYLIYFMVMYGIIRSLMIEVNEIWMEDLPNADRLLRKCREVYVARDMQNFELEEELFSEIIFIMRSREVCIKLTRFGDDPYNPSFLTPGTRRTRS